MPWDDVKGPYGMDVLKTKEHTEMKKMLFTDDKGCNFILAPVAMPTKTQKILVGIAETESDNSRQDPYESQSEDEEAIDDICELSTDGDEFVEIDEIGETERPEQILDGVVEVLKSMTANKSTKTPLNPKTPLYPL